MSNGEIKRYDLDWNYGDPIIDEDMNGDYVKHSDYAAQASTIVALKEQLAALAGLDRINEVAIRALASQPAAPVLPDDEMPISMSTYGTKGACEAEHARRAAPPVQQPGDVREVESRMPVSDWFLEQPEWKAITAERLRVAEIFASGYRAAMAEVASQALATTRPSAALTRQVVLDIAEKVGMFDDDYDNAADGYCIAFADSVLAASSGAVAVPVKGAYMNNQGSVTLCQSGREREGFGFVSMLYAAPATPAQGQTK